MTLHVPRLPFALDPLIGEAKRRARQRRFLAASALFLAALATGLTIGLRSMGGGPSGGIATAGASVRVGALRLSVPRNFRRYSIRGGIYRTGARPPVIGYVLTDYRLKAGPKSTFGNWSHFKVPPASRVALELTLRLTEPGQNLPPGRVLTGWWHRICGFAGRAPSQVRARTQGARRALNVGVFASPLSTNCAFVRHDGLEPAGLLGTAPRPSEH
jgi:hypothetical protein